jgi:hypothetical protein
MYSRQNLAALTGEIMRLAWTSLRDAIIRNV